MIEKDIEIEKQENDNKIKELKNDIIIIVKACLIGVLIMSVVALCNVLRIVLGI